MGNERRIRIRNSKTLQQKTVTCNSYTTIKYDNSLGIMYLFLSKARILTTPWFFLEHNTPKTGVKSTVVSRNFLSRPDSCRDFPPSDFRLSTFNLRLST